MWRHNPLSDAQDMTLEEFFANLESTPAAPLEVDTSGLDGLFDTWAGGDEPTKEFDGDAFIAWLDSLSEPEQGLER
jgi:hypothetical protein